ALCRGRRGPVPSVSEPERALPLACIPLPVTIRPATKADQAVLRALWEDFEEELGGEEYLRETWEEAGEDLAETSRAGVALIAEEDGEAVGFVFCVLGDRGRKTAHVTDIYVRPDVRDRGVGRA